MQDARNAGSSSDHAGEEELAAKRAKVASQTGIPKVLLEMTCLAGSKRDCHELLLFLRGELQKGHCNGAC